MCFTPQIKYDDYGEILRPDEMMDSTGDDDKKEGPESILNHVDDADFTEVPTKCVSTRQTFHVSANILFIDFEGRSDGESITKVVHQMKPRRVIVVRGKEDSLNALADFCRQIVGSTSGAEAGSGPDKKIAVFIPKNGEVVDATTESFIYQVRLPEALVSRLDFSAGKDGLLAWVDGVIRRDKLDIGDVLPIESEKDKEESSSSSTGGEDKKKLTEEEIDRVTAHIMEEDDAAAADKKVVIPTLQPVPDDEIQGHQCAFVNELKLSDFKMVLMRNGILSEFKGGVLYCGSGSVALKRHDSGRVTIEGTVSEEYFVVRSLLYEQYAIL